MLKNLICCKHEIQYSYIIIIINIIFSPGGTAVHLRVPCHGGQTVVHFGQVKLLIRIVLFFKTRSAVQTCKIYATKSASGGYFKTLCVCPLK